MANSTNVEKALLQGAKDGVGAGFTLAADNQPFEKPTDSSPWGRVLITQAPPRAATLGDDGEDLHSGIMQIDLNYQLHKGTSAVGTKAGQIEGFFTAGKKLLYGGQAVTVTSCGRSRGREVEGWYRVSMTISWEARVRR